jgi:hypothetical protein
VSEPASPDAIRIELRPLESGTGLAAVAEVVAQIPDPDSLAPGTRVVIGDAPKGSALSRIFRRATSVKTVIRASALLARGYVDIEETRDEAGAGLVSGVTSTLRPSPDP